jgi:hypothetical protein
VGGALPSEIRAIFRGKRWEKTWEKMRIGKYKKHVEGMASFVWF